MKLIFTGEFNIDLEKERNRLYKTFDDDIPARDRQLYLIDLFEQGKFDEWADVYEALPQNKIDECPEQEYIGTIFVDIMSTLAYAKFNYKDVKMIK